MWVKHATILVRESKTSPIIAIRSSEDVRNIKSRTSKSPEINEYVFLYKKYVIYIYTFQF